MLRILYPADLPQLVAIENSVHVAPWAEDTFKTCFQAGYMGWVLEQGKIIIGFIIISLKVDECHILNFCIARTHQRQGLGRKILEYTLLHAKNHGVGIAYLEVRRSNSRAISLYKKMKFHQIGERKDYYPTVNGQEDALIFAISLNELKTDGTKPG